MSEDIQLKEAKRLRSTDILCQVVLLFYS